jgi:hypothetical protein
MTAAAVPAASRLAQPALAHPADGPVDCVDLLAAVYPGERLSDLGTPVDGSWGYRGRFVARPREHRPDAEPTPHAWLAVMIPDTLWFAVAWSAAISGVFIAGASPLPLLPLAIFLPVIISAPYCCCRSMWGRCSTRCRRPGSSLFSIRSRSAAILLSSRRPWSFGLTTAPARAGPGGSLRRDPCVVDCLASSVVRTSIGQADDISSAPERRIAAIAVEDRPISRDSR